MAATFASRGEMIAAIKLLTVAVISSALLSDTATADPVRAPIATKCGRDAAFFVMQELGADVTLGEVDVRLGGAGEVSALQLHQLFADYGFDCHFSVIDRDNVRGIERYLDSEDARAILAVPPKDGSLYHFAPLISITSDGAQFLDLATNKEMLLPFWKVPQQTKIPVLLVVRRQSLVARAWHYMERVFASAWVFVGIAISLILVIFPRMPSATCTFLIRHRTWAGIIVLLAGAITWVFGSKDSFQFRNRYEIIGSGQNLGVIPLGAKETAVLRVRNPSRRSIVVQVEEITCSCMSVRPEKMEVAPDQEGVFQVDVKATTLGQSTQHILFSIQSEDRPVSRQPAEINLTAVSNETIRPTHVNLGPIPRRASFETTVAVTADDALSRGIPVSVRSLVEVEQGLAVRLPSAFVLGRDGLIPIAVSSSGSIPLGNFMQQIILTFGKNGKEFVLTMHGESVLPLYVCSDHSRMHEQGEGELCIRAQPGAEDLIRDCVIIEEGQRLVEVQRDRDTHGMRVRVTRTSNASEGNFTICSNDGHPLSNHSVLRSIQPINKVPIGHSPKEGP